MEVHLCFSCLCNSGCIYKTDDIIIWHQINYRDAEWVTAVGCMSTVHITAHSHKSNNLLKYIAFIYQFAVNHDNLIDAILPEPYLGQQKVYNIN